MHRVARISFVQVNSQTGSLVIKKPRVKSRERERER